MKIINKKDTKEKNQKNSIKIIKGSFISITISLILLLIMSMIYTYTNIAETNVTTLVMVISSVSIFIGSLISAKSINNNGLINGLNVGLIYMVSLYLISSILVSGFSINIKTVIMLVISILSGIVGGIIGVNINK